MKLNQLIDLLFAHIMGTVTKRRQREQWFELYDQIKFKLPFYLRELALYKRVLERESLTMAERQELTQKYEQTCCDCIRAIGTLDNLVCDLELENRYEAHTYMAQYEQVNRIVEKRLRLPYFTPNYN